jgi:BirA family biotin operon repressor/biotin-[acetyl-CoA-carboxylase] ligase
MEQLTAETIQAGLDTRLLGQQAFCYVSIGSTNDIAKHLARQGAPAGTIVTAEEQTAGRGRMARTWYAPAGSSLLLSVILRPDLGVERLAELLMASALAAADAIESSTGLVIDLKWPNDVLCRGKKLGGILVEAGLSAEHLDFAVVGIGLNVNLDVAQVAEIVDSATSISMELGTDVSRLELLRALLHSLEIEHERLESGRSPYRRWAARLTRIGQHVQVETPWGKETGKIEGVETDGTLVLRRTDGSLARIAVGDIT